MRNFLEDSIVKIDDVKYLSLIILICPILNFLSGINIDIYSPSMPAIANYFNASVITTKNTITITLIGWTIGALIFGILIDSLGRKKILIISLFCYTIAGLAALWCHTMFELMLIRFIQGFTISSVTIGSRALILDTIKGPKYPIAILYTSVGYGIGPIIGPFIGSVLQHYFEWQANFYALALIAFILLCLILVFIKETIPFRHSLQINQITKRVLTILQHPVFIIGVIFSGFLQIELMLYPTVGPFIVENLLHRSVIVFGNTALLAGCSYLSGTLLCRLLLKYNSPRTVVTIGCVVSLFSTFLIICFSLLFPLNLITVLLPLFILGIGGGLIFPNMLSANLSLFPQTAGLAIAIQAFLLLLISAIGIFLISHIHITSLLPLAIIISILVFLSVIIFYFYSANLATK